MSWKIQKHRHLAWWKGEAVKMPSPCLKRRKQVLCPSSCPQNRVGEAWKVKAEEGPGGQ